MAFIYQVTFTIGPEEMSQLEIGKSLERTLGYLRTLLPSESGFITSRAMYSLDYPERTHLVFQSVWERWDDVTGHRESALLEDKILEEFQPHVPLGELAAHIYEEVR